PKSSSSMNRSLHLTPPPVLGLPTNSRTSSMNDKLLRSLSPTTSMRRPPCAIMTTVLARPTSRRVAEIIGLSNVFEARVVEAGPGGTRLEWSGHRIRTIARARVGECVAFLIRQEQVRLQAAGAEPINRIHGRVCDNRRRGRRRSISVCVGDLHR